MKSRSFRTAIVLALMIGAGPAYAHAPVPGIKGFYTGLVHPFSTPAQALLLLGVGLVAGNFPKQTVLKFLAVFLTLSLIGLFAGSASADLDPAMFSVAIAACALAALAPGKMLPVALAFTAAGALLIGSVSIPDAGPARDRAFTMTGSIIGANLGFLYIGGAVLVLKERFSYAWVDIAFRVAAAWLGAISLVMLSLGFAATGAAQ